MNDGWIKLYRKIIGSDIFLSKPAEWLKIWLYILLKVNYIDSKLPRGSDFFRTPWKDITNENSEAKISKWQWHECIRYLKQTNMITTIKTTRGNIIKVLQYSLYQDDNTTPTNTEPTHEPIQNQHGTNTINKELIRIKKNDKESITTESASQETNLNYIMVLYQKKFPKQRKLYGMAGVVRARDYFDGILEGGHTLKDIEEAINKAKDSAPWKIIKPKKSYTFHPY